MVCCFTGKRIFSFDKTKLQILLYKELERLYAEGFREFRAGGALGFDTVAAKAVLALRTRHSDVRLVLYIPHPGQADQWLANDKAIYADILAAADEKIICSPHYHRACMFVRNRALVDGSDLCLAYLTESKGGTFMTVNYAKSKGVPVKNIAEITGEAL